MDRMAALENEAAEVTARLDAVRAIEGDADVIAARDLELETLCTRAAGIQKGLAFERKVAESAAALRKTVAVSAPAPAAPEQRSEIRPLPYAQKPKYFDSHETAYRSGKFIQA